MSHAGNCTCDDVWGIFQFLDTHSEAEYQHTHSAMSVMGFHSVLVLLAACLGAGAHSTAALTLSPVVIIPGDGSNQLEAKLDKETARQLFTVKIPKTGTGSGSTPRTSS